MGDVDVRVSPGLTGGMVTASLMVEVKQGKPVTRIPNLRLAFSTKAMLQKSLLALGDASTLRTTRVVTQKGLPWQQLMHPITAPAAYCQDIDVMRTDVTG